MDKIPTIQKELLSNYRELVENLQIKPNFYLINKIVEFDKKLKKDIKNELNKKTAEFYLDLLDEPYNILSTTNLINYPEINFFSDNDSGITVPTPRKFNYKDEKLFNKQFDEYKMINDTHIKNYHNLVKKILFF